jgi:ketosteroid isomerase-like protein
VDKSAQNLALAKQYLKAIENRQLADRVAEFFAPDYVIETKPNRLLPNGRRDDLARARAASEAGKKIMSSERYEVKNELATADAVALEVLWTGTLAIAYDTIPAGGQMRAHFAVFLDFRDGKIASQRNYDCFEAW